MTLIDPTAPTVDRAVFEADWNTWRDASEARRLDPYGFLSYSAVHVLDATPRLIEGVPGLWSSDVDGPVVDVEPGALLTADNSPIVGRHSFGAVAEREFRRAAQFGDVVIELSKRGGVDLLRPIDPQHGLRENYIETPAFAPDPSWVIRGEYIPFDQARETEIDAAISGITHVHEAVGEVVFELDGVESRLLFLAAPADRGPRGSAFAVFTDATSGITTYRASRSLHVILPEAGGPFDLDFNRTGNLQCAYTNYAPCPLAPAQNRLTVAIEAGEKIPVFRD